MKIEKFKELMVSYGKKLDLEFNDKQIKQFYDYMNLLLEWNEMINLTAITEPKDIILKHFIDSLTINKYIDKNETLIDVGTGAGFPGIALKIYRPDVEVTLVDSLNKRVNFLNEVIRNLELEGIEAIHSRAEDLGKDKKYRQKFKYVTARAVSKMSVLSEYLLPFLKIDGICIFMKGFSIDEELLDATSSIRILGGNVEKLDNFILPDSDIERNIIIVQKVKDTPKKYPRKAGIPEKEPIE